MKRRNIIQGGTARLVTGSSLAAAALMTVGTVAFGQADAQQSRQTKDQIRDQLTPSHGQQEGQQTFEGRIVPLYDHLAMKGGGSAGVAPSTAITPSTAIPGRSDVGQEGRIDREKGRAAGDKQSWSSQDQLAQPVALVVDGGMAKSHGSTRTTDQQERRELDPATPNPVDPPAITTDRTAREGGIHSSGGGASSDGHIYVLVFDPNNAQGRAAYQTAQIFARSYSQMVGVDRSTQPRDPLATPTPGVSPTPQIAPDRQQVRERDTIATTQAGWGEKVKVTGRVIQNGGLQAIAVEKVERASEPASNLATPPPAQKE